MWALLVLMFLSLIAFIYELLTNMGWVPAPSPGPVQKTIRTAAVMLPALALTVVGLALLPVVAWVGVVTLILAAVVLAFTIYEVTRIWSDAGANNTPVG